MKKLTAAQYGKILYEFTEAAKKNEVAGAVENFIEFVRQNQSLRKLPAILVAYEKYAKKQSGVVEMKVTSAHPMTKSTESKIVEVFGGKVEMIAEEDKALLGGVILKTENKIFDASVRTQLLKLKQQLI